ncbi:multisubunit sodium/proton antiporter MrpA subunit /multisubunit sodium/proton antiporter MrpB subunit [Halopolyspora algeriensis]|uniref:Multisubunit sodium/proton antiporter MrpA subunit /multisubunit sodium/proton antiporter MrpB subunit n=1 Tax=Halopolyspora algeriensis TaxID=1500506 RepID=A0A368VFX8_9ACTN|nr:hydrogen gas-evolving membrane-bound hydrogenase subunit E [Halopolyspora algeriensis]RCW39125.1 multisubunit sodium/proton antiporter MrpA subunit /multisubunit sodium/proton antiporter MrpB subunit [Halopolyspora algeriensis]TQM56577.1 multisubunit sodium/proton antiporter MrpA subunit /multisubunit sodium/proton antiporter MrpB subunit [Halopolyspora algeriensis]
MSPEAVLVAVPAVLGVATVVALPLGRYFGARAGYPLAFLAATSGALLLVLLPEVLEAPVTVTGRWIPALGAEWSLHLDALALVFGLVVTLVGAVVLAYSAHYLDEEHNSARYYGELLGFAASMTLLVLAGDALTLYVGWEGTTLTSYALIASAAGGWLAAVRALLITFAGGLALLAGILLAAAELDTLVLLELADASRWASTPLVAFLVLLVVAAAAKSAQAPFHVWLPPAMVAPTPVSAYLHAAAMVTAGLYLLLRFAEPIAAHPPVAAIVAVLGTVTGVFAAAAAMRRKDMKELLAYSTISQLGFMIALVGVGTRAAIAGALVSFLAHATYKSSLFLATGVYDHLLGTRELPQLAGAGRRIPLATAAVALACLSMAGLPPALGYVGKEEALKGMLSPSSVLRTVIVVGIAAALVLTFAYTVRVAVAALRGVGDRTGHARNASLPHPHLFSLGPVLLAATTVGLGIVAAKVTPLIDAAVEDSIGRPPSQSLGLWHGITPALLTSLVIYAVGGAVFGLWRARGWWRALPDDVGARCFDGFGRRLRAAGRPVERVVAHPSPAVHLAIVFAAVAVVVWLALGHRPAGTAVPAADSGPRWIVSLLLAVTAVVVAQVRGRLTALAVLGGVGFVIAAWYILHGAPQLAAVQLVVDGLTVALAMFVLRHLSSEYPQVSRRRRLGAAAAALLGGSAFAGLSLFQRTPALPRASEIYLHEAQSSSTGNLVTAILTEFRALDTLGETTVIAVAAMGVVAVIRMERESR